MFLFTYVIPGHANAWFISDLVSDMRWIPGSADRTDLVNAGVKVIPAVGWTNNLNLIGPFPP
jgi:hypothetical protein